MTDRQTTNRIQRFLQRLDNELLILDGAMGTMIQQMRPDEATFRGTEFASHPCELSGNNDILVLTAPDKIKSIHNAYINAGADIISTDTFNANAISQADYSLSDRVAAINRAAAALARQAADESGREVFVAGSVGPTNRTASISPDVNDPGARNVDFDTLFAAYSEQIEALMEGGADLLLLETVFDTLNLKAALDASRAVSEKLGREIPVMVSATLSDKAGRILSGQTMEAFIASIAGYRSVVSIGLNCSFGPEQMLPYLRTLSEISPVAVSAHPNAGLPNEFGEYDETPEMFSRHVGAMTGSRLLNIAGGCCGTTPTHIAAIAPLKKSATPREIPARLPVSPLVLSGLDALPVDKSAGFINVGERCNVAGSRKFLRLIKEHSYEEAMEIARKQIADGAKIIDINMDDALLDAPSEMKAFLNLIASDPEIARVPVMIDSSDWNVIEPALKCLQGKGIVNSISLKEGEEEFLRRAIRIRQLGAAVVVMAFDEKGQADTYERRIEICGRAYRLLVEKAAFNPADIIFDPNVMAVATGIESHDSYALSFIRAVEWIKQNLPGAKTSGGVSNLSFSFRGNNPLREAMHAVFLYHAVKAGLDMAIVNAAASTAYADVEPALRTLIEDVLLCRRKGASEELGAAALEILSKKEEKKNVVATEEWRTLPVGKRLAHALEKGTSEYLEADIAEALTAYPSAVAVIEGPLMEGMNRVGELFGEGKMFLPQVVKTARTMKAAVNILDPVMKRERNESAAKAGKVLFATVKGDVHDIGKNISSIVLSCNNYEVIDLGVMVPPEVIVEETLRHRPDIICLSGLITPSLNEMVKVATALKEAGISVPIIVGGATTSKLHTALKIAPVYPGPVVHATDASQNPLISAKLLNPESNGSYINDLNAEYRKLKTAYEQAHGSGDTATSKGSVKRMPTDWKAFTPAVPKVKPGVPHKISFSISEVEPFINWKFFFNAWKLSGAYMHGFPFDGCKECTRLWLSSRSNDDRAKAEEAVRVFNDARALLRRLRSLGVDACRALYGIFPSNAMADDTLSIGGVDFPMQRQRKPGDSGYNLSLADFVMPQSEGRTDYVGAFAVTAAPVYPEIKRFNEEDDAYSSLLLQTVADRLVEAAGELLHRKVRTEFWGYSDENPQAGAAELFRGEYTGIRPAFGYPSLPDQLQTKLLGKLLPLNEIGITLTENGAMNPPSSICGLYFAHPASRYFVI